MSEWWEEIDDNADDETNNNNNSNENINNNHLKDESQNDYYIREVPSDIFNISTRDEVSTVVTDICRSLAHVKQSQLASNLQIAFQNLKKKRFFDALKKSELTLNITWNILKENSKWPNLAIRDAHLISRLIFSICKINQNDLIEALRQVDLCLTLGGPTEVLHPIAAHLEPMVKENYPLSSRDYNESDYKIPQELPTNFRPSIPNENRIPRVAASRITPEEFESRYFRKKQPVVLVGGAKHWPAFEKWHDLLKMEGMHGHRTIPIEQGIYGRGSWEEASVTISQFIREYLVPSNRFVSGKDKDSSALKIGYCAQHSLLEQLPNLSDDILIPEFCSFVNETNNSPTINSWLGTVGTVTPLHFDAYENIFGQVCGFKYVQLYPPHMSDLLYVDQPQGENKANLSDENVEEIMKRTRAQGNVSLVDPEKPNYDRYPRFKDAVPMETVLNPGDLLYIPLKYWHYVRSLSTSFSVNFWFNPVENDAQER